MLDRTGGIATSSYSWENSRYNGLSERAYEFISDILAVAETLGWKSLGTAITTGPINREWESRKKQEFICSNGETLMEVRAYQNGNMHIKFNQQFMKKLNVEFGRLKGWLKSKEQAAEELRIKPEEAAEFFNTTFQLTAHSSKLLLASPDADITTPPEEESPLQAFDNPGKEMEFTAEEATQLGAFEDEALGDYEQLELIAV